MVTETKPNLKPGVYVRGSVLSSTATLFNRKDNSGQFVRVRHEISTKPGVIDFEQIFDPVKDGVVKVEGGKVVAFPTYPEDSPIMLKFEPGAIREFKSKVKITRAELIT
jgi:hypothetical protein